MFKNMIKDIFVTGRRGFLKTSGIAVSMLILGYRGAEKVYAETKDYIATRINAVYSHDKVMKYRKSQDNPFVKKLYGNFLPRPLCPKSENLLHAQYVDRSKGLAKINDPHGKLKND